MASSQPGMEMEPGDEKTIENNTEFYLDAFEPYIRRCLSTQDLHSLILGYEKFDHDEKARLLKYSDNKVPDEVFTEIIQSIRRMKECPVKYTALKRAFAKSGHEKAYLLLNGEALPDNDTHKKVLYKCSKEFRDMLMVEDILPDLIAKELINESDRQVIDRLTVGKGSHSAAIELLKCLPNKKVEWYPSFMNILLKNNYEDLAEVFDEELRRLRNDGEDTCISMKIIYNRQSGSCSSDGHLSQVMSGQSSVVEHIMSDSQEPEAMNEGIPPPVPRRFDSLTESAYKTCDQPVRSVNEDVEQANQTRIWEGDSSSSEDDADDTNDSSSFRTSDYEDSSGEQASTSSTLKLRDYQLELAENALAGRNTVIVAGTGSGKTWVALHIVKEHLSQAHQGIRKVVFMARTSALIEQQADRFKRYLHDFETKLVTGEKDESGKLGIFVKSNDILCFTPQILVNNLDNGSIKSLSEFSLLILDECHHTVGDEPYSTLMRKYLIEKAAHKGLDLPQIVGLTASVGVGKSNTDEDAVEHLLKLFARLDVLQLSTVQRCKQHYERISYSPKEELIAMVVPDTDHCKEILLKAIHDTEKRLKEFTLLNPAMIDTVVVNCPPEKESQAYAKWAVTVEKTAMNSISDDETLRNVRTCAVYLNVYNAAIEVNSLLGPSDVIRFLAKKHELDNTSQERLTSEEKDLLVKLKGVQKKLSKHVKNENPNVRKLSDSLRKMMHKNVDESRAMVFVKARATCVALASFLKKDFAGTGIDVHELYGKENRGGIDGMTESIQNDTVVKFRNGFYKVLVATSVGVEGIDVPDCNIVLNYNFQGNEITKIQMKGRSRKKDGVHMIIGDKKQLETEEINAYKLAMMQRALKRFLDMDPKESSRKISLYQKEEMNKYKMKNMIKENKRKRKRTEEDFEIRCRRCNTFACYTSDIRTVKCQYIVIDNSFEEKIIMKPHERPKMFDGFHKKFKMYCKKCPQDWGIVSDNRGLLCRTLKLDSFKLRNMRDHSIEQYTKWDDVPVVIRKIDVDDLDRHLGEVQ